MKKIFYTLSVCLLTSAISLPLDALAEKGGNGKGNGKWDKPSKSKSYKDPKGKSKGGKSYKHSDRDDVRVVIESHDRVVIREYIARDYRFNCPPGLAKKHNGCLPPGHARKYVVGQILPDYVVWSPLPHYVVADLRPVPAGYQYVMVDRDVLLINQASHHIIDAITLLSAVGN